jgi:hypothetical protein
MSQSLGSGARIRDHKGPRRRSILRILGSKRGTGARGCRLVAGISHNPIVHKLWNYTKRQYATFASLFL